MAGVREGRKQRRAVLLYVPLEKKIENDFFHRSGSSSQSPPFPGPAGLLLNSKDHSSRRFRTGRSIGHGWILKSKEIPDPFLFLPWACSSCISVTYHACVMSCRFDPVSIGISFTWLIGPAGLLPFPTTGTKHPDVGKGEPGRGKLGIGTEELEQVRCYES